jgi:hypothetical protein
VNFWKALMEEFSRPHHFRFQVPLQVDCCYSWMAGNALRTKTFANAK